MEHEKQPPRVADFRSDTVTRPSRAMLDAMMSAEVGDDVLEGDPTVGKLERRVAELLGKDGALFVPSGTMANSVAVGAWTRPGDELVIERSAHMVQWEAGAAGFVHGVQSLTLHAADGRLDPDEIRRVARPKSLHCPKTALICVEQSFMGSGESSGGRVIPLAHLREVRRVAQELGVPVHLDGARLFNAVVASGVSAREFAECADSVSICLSKGLGCPVGSLIAGPRDFLERGKLVRKRLGGWMRQSGILAAAGLYALEHNVERLAQDHALARELAAAVAGFDGFESSPNEVETNIVMARVARRGHDPMSLMGALKQRNVLVLPQNANTLRFVTHMDVGREGVEQLRGALGEILR
jgi:threonine aldolase